jgi:carboxyl-terminal processing protease
MTGRRMALVACLLTQAIACGGSAPAAPTPPAAAGVAYLREVIGVMQAHSVNRKRIDWPAFQTQVLGLAGNAPAIPDTYAAIELALRQLDDHHSFYQLPNSSAIISNPTPPGGCSLASVPDPAVPGDIGYVRIPSFSSDGPGAAADEFAASLQSAIRARDSAAVAGWIVDLRGNGGGNMWPMLAGVGPIVGDGTAGFFVEPEGRPASWGYAGGAALQDGNVESRVTVPYELIRPSPRVAVLTDRRVASSGEAIAVAFRGRPNTRSFGTGTCGLPTANENFTLSDGAILFLTVAVDADRTMTTYSTSIAPDEQIEDAGSLVQRAIAWLRAGG